MKKIIVILLALMLSLMMCAAVAEEEDAPPAEAVEMFDSQWYCEDARAQVVAEDGGFKIMIDKAEEDGQAYCWFYSALYDAEAKRLVAVMNVDKYAVEYTDDGSVLGDQQYSEMVDASFALDENGHLLWYDGKEDAGKGLSFEKIGWYDDTVWICDRATIEMYWELEGYKVHIEWGSSAWEYTDWNYSCYYDPATNSLSGLPFGLRTDYVFDDAGNLLSATDVYDDGEADFRLDEEGYLIWEDHKEDAGAGMRFERTDIPLEDDGDSNG